ncbi:MAG: hypothetical protein ACP5JJ_16520 [Anaerolineae bacterium]
MTNKSPQLSKRQWEQALIDAYYDHRWRQILEPLYEKFKRWDAGELDHADMDQAIHETHKETQKAYGFFRESRSMLVAMIEWDRDWFIPWLKDHQPPPNAEVDPLILEELEGKEPD